jgi:lipopolysaccharide export system permease protein
LDLAAGGTTFRARRGATLTFEAPQDHAHATDWPSADPIRARPTSRQPEALHPATVLTIIDRYLIRQILLTCLVMTGVGLAILVLERLLQLFALVANPDQAFRYVGQMLVLLLPHYLSIALPAAFFFGVLLTFRRLQRDSELVVLSATGRSLGRLLAPALGLACVMTVLAALIVGWLAPHARYGYRALKAQVAEASLTAAVLGGTFIQAEGITFFAEQAEPAADGLRLAKVFVHQQEDDGQVVVTGEHGLLGQVGDDQIPVLILEQGLRAEIPQDGAPTTLAFGNLSWPVIADEEASYRPRGRDQRELTLAELWTFPASATSKPDQGEIAAELHARLVLIATMPLLPVLAAPLALAGGPRRQRGGVVLGLLILVVYYEALSFGEQLAKRELLSPWLGLWLPFAALAAGSLWLFLHRLRGGRPRRGRA